MCQLQYNILLLIVLTGTYHNIALLAQYNVKLKYVHRYIVGDRFHDGPKTSGHKKETCRYHHMNLCPQLKTYKSVTSEVINSKIKATRLQSSNQQNIFHYFIYNRLMDYFHNIGIVQKQHSTLSSRAQCGEKVVRDSLYRFVYKKC